jgi:hypothetical protein
MESVQGPDSVAVHVRRGDYVSLKQAAHFHGLCDMDYYRAAMATLNQKYSGLKYFVFSDDITWCRSQFGNTGQISFIEDESDKRSSQDLFIMSACRHQVIANSSYSWWAAWLKDSSGDVIAPKNWFSDPSINTSDLYPGKWIRL